MQIGKQEYPYSSTNLEGGGKLLVDILPVEVTFSITPRSIMITSDKDNVGTLYIGKDNITSNGDNAITYLSAGDVITLDYDGTASAIYVVSSISSQYFWKGGFQ